MGSAVKVDLARVAKTVGLSLAQVESTVELLDSGNTVPFITRYRRDHTGGLDEEQIRHIQSSLLKLRQLEERKATILRSIQSQGKLTDELARQIDLAASTKRLEDLYLPYRPKKQTLATAARQRGLEPLAREILLAAPSCADLDARAQEFVDTDRDVATAADALLGAGHILAEQFSERADVRQRVRRIFRDTGALVTARAEGADEKLTKSFHDYLEFRERLGRLPPHRVLAINRGERAKALRVRIDADQAAMQREAELLLVPVDHPQADFLRGCVTDALTRLIVPSLEREVRREMTDNAESHAVEVFACNLRNLLLQPPLRGKRVLAVDPGFKSGCKLAALDEFGSVLTVAVVSIIGSDERKAQARETLTNLITEHRLSVIAVGNGTACRETEELVAELISGPLAGQEVAYVVVNEAGASVYSTSPVGREEFPQYDAMQRSAISIGRRLQDPLSELVKIDPASIGVGLYQHDAKAKHLRSSLDDVVQSCVSFVGVDVNTASPALLRYVSGLNQLTARRLYEHRAQHGPFRSREQLRKVVGLGEATFIQAAGFLKIADGENPLDTTWIHPESYAVARSILDRFQVPPQELTTKTAGERIRNEAAKVDSAALAEELQVGRLLVDDVISALARPGRDPREGLPAPVFRKDVVKLEDLTEGMELEGSVLNVVDFGAFVDIGLSDSGLVHVSQLADRYVRDPHEVVSVGDRVKVWVTAIDKSRRRVSLTMIKPGTERQHPPRHGKGAAKAGGEAKDAPAARRPQRRPKKGRRDKPRPARATVRKNAPPAVPITKEMEEGSEPMRTFGDLLQYHQKKADTPEEQQSKQI
ncbi:MAG: Tex family protein [Pirellulales bacterium]